MRLWFQFGSMMLFPLGNLFLAAMLVLYRKKRQTSALFPLVVALILNGIWASGLAADFVGRDASSMLVFWWRKAAEYALPLASAAIMFATLSFLRHKRPVEKRWLYLTLAGLGGALLLDPDVFPLYLPDTRIAGRIISHEGWWQIAWTISWGVPAAVALWSIVLNYPRKASPLHRNRVRYWALAVGINLLGDLLVIYSKEYFQSQQPIVMQGGALVKILGAAVATINALAYRLPDMRIVLRRTIEIVALGAATMGLFILAMMGEQLIQQQLQEPKAIFWATVGLALLLTISYYPVRHLVSKAVEGLVFRAVFDLDAVLRDYGEHISQVLELDRLAQTVIETVDSALCISHGTLALVKEEARGELTLVPVTPHGRSPLPTLTCAHDSPLTRYLADGAAPLAQYDVDMLLIFAGLSDAERETLAQWDAELYVPIRARGQVIGLLALGAKQSGDPYVDADIVLLRTLADQTALALENARLFADLKTLNQEVTELNLDLEQANLDLLELDKLKTSFIGTITHELRSPFVPIDLALQLVEKHGLENMLPEQREQIEQLSDGLVDLRRMIDNLISFASLVGKQKALRLTEVHVDEVAQEAIKTLDMIAKARRVSVRLVVTEALPAIAADRERLSDVIHHLVHNAIKFNRSGGTVEVHCGHKEGQVIIAVDDTGRGIPADKVDILGDPFVQLTDPMKRGIEGMGLGLALVKYIAQAHGGVLKVESKLGVGSAFSVHLPIGEPTKRRLSTPAS